jgi:competence protein ComEC
MRTGTVAFLLGILLLLQFSNLPGLCSVLISVSAVLSLVWNKILFRTSGFVLLGFLWAMLRAEIILTGNLHREIEGQTLLVTGRIVSLPEINTRRIRFEFLIDRLLTDDGTYWSSPGKVMLSWYGANTSVVPGQIWQLALRLKRPYGFMNPGGFDYEGWLFQHRIRAIGYVTNHRFNKYTGISNGQFINRLRYFLRNKIISHSGNSRFLGLVTGLGLGDRSYITAKDRDILNRTGTNHLLAISGLHIGLISGLYYFIACWFWSVCGKLPLYFPAPRFAAIAAIFGACCYAILAGMSIPTQRALIMVIVFMLSLISNRQYAFSVVMCFAMLLVLIYDPFAVMAPGFWLSFFAVALIAYGMMHRVNTDSFWWRWCRPQYLVAVGLIPVLLIWFKQFSVVSILANLVAIPWISLIVVPLVLAVVLVVNISETLGTLLLHCVSMALDLLWPFLELLGKSDIAVWHQSAPPIWAFAGALLGIIILLQPRAMPSRWLGLVWILPVIFPIKEQPSKGEFWLTLLDVGQGLSAVIRTREHALVYDTGAKFSDSFNAGAAVVVPYLRQSNIDVLDLLVVSHGDNDHIGGSGAILADFPETTVLTSVPEKFNHPSVGKCLAGQRWHWNGIRFAILHPELGFGSTRNNLSCVLKISRGQQVILLTGDIEREAETHLIGKYGKQLSATVLVAPHHGSRSSSTKEFIHMVQPELVLFPTGYRNRFSFPNEDIIKRYAAENIQSYDTARHGAVLIRFDKSGISVNSYRQVRKRFWHTEF